MVSWVRRTRWSDWNGELNQGHSRLALIHVSSFPQQMIVYRRYLLKIIMSRTLILTIHSGLAKRIQQTCQQACLHQYLKMDWSHGHNQTIHNGISRIGFYTGGHAARFRDEDLADTWVKQSKQFIKKIDLMTSHSSCFCSTRVPCSADRARTISRHVTVRGRCDAILELDWCVGELTQTLADEGLTNDTLIVFVVIMDRYSMTDTKIKPLKKMAPIMQQDRIPVENTASTKEARGPLLLHGQAIHKPRVSNEMVCTIDLATSLNHLVDHHIHDNDCLDSLDVSDALLAKKEQKDATTSSNKTMAITETMGCELATGSYYDTNVAKHVTSSLNRNLQTQMFLNTNFDLDVDPAEKNNLYKINRAG